MAACLQVMAQASLNMFGRQSRCEKVRDGTPYRRVDHCATMSMRAQLGQAFAFSMSALRVKSKRLIKPANAMPELRH